MMGAVTLHVADLDAMTRYYTEGVGLDVIASGPGAVTVGRGTTASLVLRHAAALKHAPRAAAGLYHTAVLFDSRSALAASVYSVASKYPASFTGSSDHLVSQAFYFDDPEGNGVELYWDRPRSGWQWDGRTVRMGTLALDPNAFLQQHLRDDARPLGLAEVGHVHLKVGDIATAHGFYVDVLGFEVTARFGEQALFVSAGGYHHHVGMNTWESRGAGPRTPALGLGQVALRLPDTEALGALGDRLRTAGIAVQDDGRELVFADPWHNAVRAAVTAGTTGPAQ
jgi:catechol 2,3-dioxygenase